MLKESGIDPRWDDGLTTEMESEMSEIIWDGKGLPPVGCECIVDTDWSDDSHIKMFNGKKVKIVMHDICPEGECVAVFKMIYPHDRVCEAYHGLIAGNFKSIKSERDKAIEEMQKIMNRNGYMLNPSVYAEFYDAGYRKIEQNKSAQQTQGDKI